MSFAESLLDGFDLLNKRTGGGLKSAQNFIDFYKNLAKIEKEYGRALSKLAQNEKKEYSKHSPATKEVGSTLFEWETIFGEIDKIGEFHNQLAAKIENDLCTHMSSYIKEKEKTRKKLENDSARIVKEIKAQHDNLSKAKSKYVTLTKEAESLEKGLHDVNVKPSNLPKMESKHKQAEEKAEQADRDYQGVLQQTNQKQHEYYTAIMPSLLKEFQEYEEERVIYLRSQSLTWASWNAEEPIVMQNICATITTCATNISADIDIKAYCSENATGVTPPPDIDYVSAQESGDGGMLTPRTKPKASASVTKKGGKPADREWGLTATDNFLSDDEKRTKLNGQADELDKALASENKALAGVENLVRFYAADPVAKKKAEEELSDINGNISKLSSGRDLVASQLASLGGSSVYTAPAAYNEPAATNYGYDNYSAAPASPAGVQARCLYTYTAGADTELSFNEGDIITITNQDDDSWWYAELHGNAGFVPNNYVQLL